MKLLVVLCVLACIIQSESKAGRSSGGGSRGGGSRGSSHSWSSWSRPSSSVSKPSYSKPSHTVSKPSAPEHHSSSHSVGWNVHSSHGSQPAHNPHFSSHSSAGSLATGAAAYPRGPPSASVGGSHSYPASSGLSGSGTLQQTRVNPVSSGIGGSHSYPQGPPISASGSHSYPQSSGLSGSGTLQQTRVNPVSSGIGGSHSNPQISPISASGSHSYPQSGGLSGSGTGYKPYTPVGSNVPSYPVSTGLSGGGVGAHATATNARPNYNNPPAYSGYNQPAYPPAYSVHAPSPSHSGYHPNPPAYGGYQAPPPAYGGYHPPPAYGGGYAHQPIYSGYSQPMYTPYNPTFVSHSSSGSGISNLLTGLAIYNLARSSGHHDTHVYHHDTVRHTYDRAPARSPAPIDSPSSVPLTDLSNCTLTLTTSNGTNVVGIPCGIASSFAPNAKVNDTTAPPIAQTNNGGDSCTISVVRKGVVENTKIPCDFLTKLQEDANKPLPGQINCTVLNPSDAYDPKVPPCRMISNTVNEEEFKVIPLKKPEPSPPEVIGSTPLASSTAAPPSIYPDLSQISTDIPAVVPLSGTVSSTTAPLPDSSSSPPNA